MKKISTIFILLIILVVSGGVIYFEFKSDKREPVENENRMKLRPEKGDRLFSLGSGYSYFGENVYYEGKLIENASGSDFQNLGNGYAKDNNSVFYEGKILNNADPLTLKRKEKFLPIYEDKNSGYYMGQSITYQETDDLIKFLSEDIGGEDLGNSYRKYDGKIYYWADGGGQAVPSMVYLDINPEDYEIIDTGCVWDKSEYRFNVCDAYIKDGNKVYWDYFELRGADPASFELINKGDNKFSNDFSKDNARVFYDSIEIENADPETFEIISDNYEKDKERVYLRDYNIPGADPDTFVVVSDKSKIAKDKNHFYLGTGEISEKKFNDYAK